MSGVPKNWPPEKGKSSPYTKLQISDEWQTNISVLWFLQMLF